MKPIAASLPNQNALSEQQTKQSQKFSPRKLDQLKHLLTQCYDSLQIYGRDPEAIKNQLITFSDTLQEQTIEDITQAFREWLKVSDKFPTPKDIYQSCLSIARERRELSGSSVRARRSTVPYQDDAVSWSLKTWSNYTDADKAGLEKHLIEFGATDPEKCLAYKKYLNELCAVPRDWLGLQ